MKWYSILYRVGLYKTLWILGLLLIAVVLQQNPILKPWNNQLYDVGLTMFSRADNKDIVIISIDKYSLKKLGHWPWSRRKHAELIEQLTAAHVRAIGLDLAFDKPDLIDPAGDKKLIQAIRNNGRVILPVFPESPNPNQPLQALLPWPALVNAAAGLGHVDVDLDSDGVVRSTCLQAGIKGLYWPSFALALLSINEPNNQRFLKGERPSPAEDCPCWQRDFRINLPFVSADHHFKQVSYADVLTNAKTRAGLRGKIVLVGTTSAGLAHLYKTPLHKQAKVISGTEINAYELDVLLNNLSIQILPKLWTILLTLVLVGVPVISYTLLLPNRSLPISCTFCVLTLIVSALLLKMLHFWYGPIPTLVVLLVGHIIWSWHRLDFFTRLLFSERKFAKAALHSIADAVITTSCKGFIEYMNPAAEQLTGYSIKAALGLHLDTVLTFSAQGNNATQELDSVTRNVENGHEFKTIMPRFLTNHLGEEYAIQVKGMPIKDDNGQIAGMVFTLNDLTRTLQISSKIAHLATHDPLTGLPNRILLQENVANAILSANRNGNHFALLFIDLDGFKKINDGMGHTIGDLLLKEVATRLRTDMRQLDTAARWGGDEFVVLLNHLPTEETISPIATKILQRLAPPYYFAGQKLYVTPSIGISIYPKDGVTTETLLAHADAAMYRVKEDGRNNFSFYSNGLNESAKKRLIMEKEMYAAFEAGHFEVFYQPQINLSTNKIVGAEALLRWNHPQKGLIQPGTFIALAEEIGLINPISEWLLNTVCAQQHLWQQSELPFITVAINLSPRQFSQNDLCQRISQALLKHKIKSGSLKVEITENLMIKDVDRVIQTLLDIKALGVSIAIDDFGTGYSSLSTLQNFPIDQLKIDKSFIDQMVLGSNSSSIIQTIIMLGHNMQMDVVAEGVETLEQFNHLNDWQCDLIQGYYFSRPLKVGAMTALLAKNNAQRDTQYLYSN
jgi:diguanylate cyclase (GGDEF)-like protein/PAS domain S-box-containing protein